MDLKEKILQKFSDENNDCFHFENKLDLFDGQASTIFKAMDELSKIVVIAFDIWRVNNGWIRCSNAKHQITYFGVNNRLEKITYTTEQLYELFTQSKEYKELMNS